MNAIIAFIFAIELGFVPASTGITYVDDSSFKGLTRLEAGFSILNTVFITGDANIFIENNNLSFMPLQADFTIKAFIKLSDNIEIGYIHKCLHPIISDWFNTNRGYNGVVDELYIKVKGEVKLF